MNKQERADDSILELFCDIDDFCQACQAVMVEDVSYKLTEVTGKAKKIRNRATGISMNDQPIRVAPDESVTSAALTEGAGEVASHLARSLIEEVRTRR